MFDVGFDVTDQGRRLRFTLSVIPRLSTSRSKDTNSHHPPCKPKNAHHKFPMPDAPLALGSTLAGDPRYGSSFLNPAFVIISVNVVSGRLKYMSGGE